MSAANLNLSPQRKREMLFQALLHQLEALARSRPVFQTSSVWHCLAGISTLHRGTAALPAELVS
jgi:hypothetical protein